MLLTIKIFNPGLKYRSYSHFLQSKFLRFSSQYLYKGDANSFLSHTNMGSMAAQMWNISADFSHSYPREGLDGLCIIMSKYLIRVEAPQG